MTLSASAPLQPPEFDNFLFAPIGEQQNGMALTVVSALARLDLDPWQEAGDLARLPKSAARERMSSLLAALPERMSRHTDTEAIAARLVALLPIEDKAKSKPRAPSRRVGAPLDSRVLVFAMVMAALLGAQWLMRPHSPAEPAASGASIANTVSPSNVRR